MLFGDTKLYKKYLEEFEEELRELSRFGYRENFQAWQRVINNNKLIPNEYDIFSNRLHGKILDLPLEAEMVCIAECRSFLYSYDDFIFGLRINQELFNRQENMYSAKSLFKIFTKGRKNDIM